jgi:1-acyl-sn-glycerol-3-phosphate acyltransferase
MAGMWIAVFLATLLGILLFWELMLRVGILLHPRSAFPFMSAFQHAASRRLLGLARTYCGFGLGVSGYRGRMPSQCLVIANHQSLVDIPVLMRALPELDLRFVAKRELGRGIPAVSLTLRAAQHALIGRKSGFAQANWALRNLALLAERGVSPVVFPEGTRSRDGEVKQFHAAAVRVLSEATGLPILSVAVDGGHPISNLKGLITNLRGTSYRVAPLTLYPPVGSRTELSAVLASARDEIAARLRIWREAERGLSPRVRGA